MQKLVLFLALLSLSLTHNVQHIISEVNNSESTWVAGHNEYFEGRTFE